MTAKIAEFLARERPQTPCLVVDLDVVAARYRAVAAALPAAALHYAVKANPAPAVLERLAGLGAGFDAASVPEIEACLAAGAAPTAISYGNTAKKEADIARAAALGVELFAFDTAAELAKLARAAPGARVCCRLVVANAGAQWPLAGSFGCDADAAAALLTQAGGRGLVPDGISFHVGSQQTDVAQWDRAIARAAAVFEALDREGVALRGLNLGGCYPVRYRRDVPDLADIATAIEAALARHFRTRRPALMAEPGRTIVAPAGVIRAEVVLVGAAAPGDASDARRVCLDIGRYGGLVEAGADTIDYPIHAIAMDGPTGPVSLVGPTCDAADVLYEAGAGYEMPLALGAGDAVEIGVAGAYTASYATVGFNGFAPLAAYYI